LHIGIDSGNILLVNGFTTPVAGKGVLRIAIDCGGGGELLMDVVGKGVLRIAINCGGGELLMAVGSGNL